MKPVILVRYAEIGVKLGRTRRLFEDRLVRNIKCKTVDLVEYVRDVRRLPGRIVVETTIAPEEARNLARRIASCFGVLEAIPAWSVPNSLASLKEVVAELAAKLKPGSRFAVRARRVEAYPVTSKELERILGAEALRANPDLRVDLEEPDEIIRVEVRTRRAYVYLDSWRERGVGGLPYGVEGWALVPVTSDDDLLAAWLVARRGARLQLYYEETRADQVERFVEKWVPCRDALLYETSNPLKVAAERAARGAGLLVSSRVTGVETSLGRVWSLSPLEGIPGRILEALLERYSTLQTQ